MKQAFIDVSPFRSTKCDMFLSSSIGTLSLSFLNDGYEWIKIEFFMII